MASTRSTPIRTLADFTRQALIIFDDAPFDEIVTTKAVANVLVGLAAGWLRAATGWSVDRTLRTMHTMVEGVGPVLRKADADAAHAANGTRPKKKKKKKKKRVVH